MERHPPRRKNFTYSPTDQSQTYGRMPEVSKMDGRLFTDPLVHHFTDGNTEAQSAQSREGKAQARRSQGLFASALRRSSKAGLGEWRTDHQPRAIPVTLIPVRTCSISLRNDHLLKEPESPPGPAFCPLLCWARPAGHGHSTCPLSTAVGPGEAELPWLPELQRLGRRCSPCPSFDVLVAGLAGERRGWSQLACQPPSCVQKL